MIIITISSANIKNKDFRTILIAHFKKLPFYICNWLIKFPNSDISNHNINMTLILLVVILTFGVYDVNAELVYNKLEVKPAGNEIIVSGVSRENEQNINIQTQHTSLLLDNNLTHSTRIINYFDNRANGTKLLVSEYCKKPFNRSIFPNILHPQKLTNADRELLVDTIYGFNVYVDSLDATVSKTIANSGTWEPHMISLIASLVKPGDSILNVGSHIGLEAVIMGKIIGQHGRLYVVQPYSFSYSLLDKNIRLNGLNNISQTYQMGASDKTGKGLITVSIGNTGASEIREDKTKSMEESPKLSKFNHKMQIIEQVSLIQIDELLSKQTVLDFALIDVQKMQVPVLIGMKSVILRSPDLVIMVEWQYGHYKKANRQQTQKLLNFMLDNGYRVYRYVKNSLDHQKECELGKFVQFRRIETLFHIIISEIFFFPKHKAP